MSLYYAPLTRARSDMPGNIPNSMMAEHYAQRSGPDGADILITEATPICPEGHGYYATPGIHTEEQVAGWKRVTDAVHERGSEIWCQLWHVGRLSHTALQPGGRPPVSSTGTPSPRHVYVDDTFERILCSPPRALETEEIPDLVESYRTATVHAMAAGFDGVEIHGANGYLIEQFLRSGVNDRTDRYGGSLDNRMRLALEVTEAVASVRGADRVGYRVSPIYGDLDADRGEADMLETYGRLAEELAAMNIAFLDVVESFTVGEREPGLDVICERLRAAFSGGPDARSADGRLIRQYVAGGGFTKEDGDRALASGRCDHVMYGRLLIAKPDLGRRFREGLPLAEPDPDTFYGGGPEGYTDYPAWS
jgi:N-ethylmaleimide reductase